MDYHEFLHNKTQLGGNHGFYPMWLPDWLFDFQESVVSWCILKGRAALMADCGTGKGPMGLVWAQNVVMKTNKKVLIAAPISVSNQFLREGEKFGVALKRSRDGKPKGDITITNYERLHLFDPSDYIGFLADESSIVKNFDAKTKAVILEFVRLMPYRLLASATASPNDYTELGNHSEVLGELGFMDMLSMFFRNSQNSCDTGRWYAMQGGPAPQWRFKKHAETHFWRWVASWARAFRKPSDLGFDDGDFVLPSLKEQQHIIDHRFVRSGELFPRPARGRKEELQELRETIVPRCEKMAEIMSTHERTVGWCDLNQEGKLLAKLVPDCVEISGTDSDDEKEEKILAFLEGQAKRLITKAKIAGLGLNLQFCDHTACFPTHSYESHYQRIRRFWRFGQVNPVTVDIITTPGASAALKNMQRKSIAAEKMFDELVKYMSDAMRVETSREYVKKEEPPQWLSKNNTALTNTGYHSETVANG